MAVIVFLTLAVLGIVQKPLQLDVELDVAINRLVAARRAAELWDLEQIQEQNRVTGEVLLLASFQQWWFWASALGAGALVLLLWLCWRTREGSCKSESSCKNSSPRSQEEEEEEKEEEEEEEVAEEDDGSGDTCDLGQFLSDHIQWPVPYMADTCKLVEDLVNELLSTCQRFSGSNFKPQLQQASGMGCIYDGWSAWENNVLYRLLVPLQSPPGHASCLELGTSEEMLTSNSCLHVQLQCMCIREQLVEDVLCFLHHHEDDLKSQDASPLNTLCTNSYLDEKTAYWFQMLMKDTWKFMPQSHPCQLTVLPSTYSCKLRLVHTFQEILSIEMVSGVQLDDSDSFLSLE
ncbi:LOW QUALITY PROTEIN: inositol 1,4,5-trisphosphate receptor-interacting protein-like 1 [Cariama cristata]